MTPEDAAIERLRRVHNGEDVCEVYEEFPFAQFFYETDLRVLSEAYFDRLEASAGRESDSVEMDGITD